MDENADRAQVPGQQPVPERDIEPLWPPDPGAGAVVPPWASVADQRGGPPPAVPPSVVPPPVPAPTGRPPVPGQPGAPAMAPPSPSDYPSLTGVPAPGGWGATGPSGTASGWATPQPGWTPPADPPTPPAPEAPAPTAGVDLDLPFSLDRPAAPADGTTPAAPELADRPAPIAPAPADRPAPIAPAPADRPAPIEPAATVPADPAATDPSTGQSTPPVRAATDPGADPPGPADPGEPAPTDSAAERGVGASAVEDGPAVGTARPTTESPWAQPPQRPAGTAHDEAAAATPPIPAPPGPQRQPPYPPGPQPQPPYPAAPHAGTGQTPPAPVIPGQVPIPSPPDPTQFGAPQFGGPAPQQAPPVTPPPGPFPPSPGWYPPPWQQGTPGAPPPPQQPYQEADAVAQVPSTDYPDATWTPETTAAPTAEDFARRRQVRPADPVATTGVRAVVNKMGLLRLAPGRHEQELKRDIEMVRRNFGGLRQVTVVNPKGGAGKTVAILLLAMTFGQKRGGYVLAWDNNETQGTLGMRAQQDFHSRTVRDMLRDLGQFQGAHGRVGDLSQYVRSQGEGMFDVLASDESATGGEMLTAAAFAEIREVVSRFYKLIFVDTGNNVRAQNWQASMDATDQLVVTMSARNDSAETAARMLDHLEQSGRQRLVRQAVTVVSMPPSRKEIDLPAIQEHFAARTRAVLLAPYERLIDTGEPIRYGGLSSATRDAWLKIAASVAEGL
ncbi:chromosome partitioning protein [Micromonospora sp. CPCC 205539]|uniref:MinD/ParA family ATP-binding protein n=1 Tax=Micromonospora sp. CPCC 205539 TaxID=3122408 RepID=UPI002FEEEE03